MLQSGHVKKRKIQSRHLTKDQPHKRETYHNDHRFPRPNESSCLRIKYAMRKSSRTNGWDPRIFSVTDAQKVSKLCHQTQTEKTCVLQTIKNKRHSWHQRGPKLTVIKSISQSKTKKASENSNTNKISASISRSHRRQIASRLTRR